MIVYLHSVYRKRESRVK